MFLAKFSAIVLSAVTLSSGVFSTPIERANINARTSYSLDQYDGFPSMSGFDNFYGSDNYDGSHYSQHFDSQDVIICHTKQVEIIQQRLLVLREMAKRIITEQICEVETQTIVLHQHLSNIDSFYGDLHRHSGRSVGYDHFISGKYGEMFDSDGSLNSHDLGFSGHDVGNHYVSVQGSNWSDDSSPNSVEQATIAAESARQAARN